MKHSKCADEEFYCVFDTLLLCGVNNSEKAIGEINCVIAHERGSLCVELVLSHDHDGYEDKGNVLTSLKKQHEFFNQLQSSLAPILNVSIASKFF